MVAGSDLDLLEAWRRGDAAAGDALIRRHYPAVLRFFEVRSRNADDLTQRTFLACVEGHEQFRGDSKFRTYLFSIARRVYARDLADTQHAARMSRFDEPETARRTSLSTLMARRQEQQVLLAALATLREREQSLIVLHYWERLPSREISEIMEVPASTVTTRLSRARAALRERVAKIEADSPVLADLEEWTRSIAPGEGLRLEETATQQSVRRILARNP